MNIIKVSLLKHEDESYDIAIGEGILNTISDELKEANLGHKTAIITDSNVEILYGNKLLKDFEEHGIEAHMISFPAGEQSKNRQMKSWIEDCLIDLGFARDSAIVALGGGVVGDMAGYVAATYTRGVPYVQIPTSLVACVDSSIGGKTAVDTPQGKNLIGAFYQPYKVYVDVNTLLTLGAKEIREGLAEVIKYGIIKDKNLFDFLERKMDTIFAYDKDSLKYIIKTGCEIKSHVVENDEKELNLRKILNFGHTVGHAVENLSNYEMTHGEAISVGMVVEGKIAVKMGLWTQQELDKLFALLKLAELPTDVPSGMTAVDINKAMKLDKKSRGGNVEMVLPIAIGDMAEIDGSYGLKIEESLILDVI